MSVREAATSVPSAPLLSCVLRLSAASHAAVCAPALGASLTSCQRSVRLRCRPAERLGGLDDQCEHNVHAGSADPMLNPGPPFYVPTRNSKKRELPLQPPPPPPPQHIWSQKDNVFGAKRRAKQNKKKQPGDYFTRYCTGAEQRSPETRFIPELLGRTDIGGACQLP